jgi:hypothetical protein
MDEIHCCQDSFCGHTCVHISSTPRERELTQIDVKAGRASATAAVGQAEGKRKEGKWRRQDEKAQGAILRPLQCHDAPQCLYQENTEQDSMYGA